MRIRIVCPATPGSLSGNSVTAMRWARVLRKFGHRVSIASDYNGEPCDLLIALHARKSARAALRYRKRHRQAPLLVALTGTDLYRDLGRVRAARRALEAADWIVALQPLAAAGIAPHLRPRLRVIYQSAEPAGIQRKSARFFDVCVAGHLRAVKDPFRTAYAVRLLPPASCIRVLHAGRAMTSSMSQKALAEQARNPRYRWLGPLGHQQTRRLIARSHILVLSSRMEGGANVVSEAVVDRTPVIASRIPGSVGLLGKDYPGYFPVGDARALRALLLRAEADTGFYRHLQRRGVGLTRLFRPAEERRRWRSLLREVAERQTRK